MHLSSSSIRSAACFALLPAWLLAADDAPGTAAAAELVVAVPNLNGDAPIRLDGAGGHPWDSAFRATNFVCAAAPNGQPAQPSTVQILQAGNRLLVACEATEVAPVVARETAAGGPLWNEDAFVIELRGARTLAVMANPLGALTCSLDGRDAPALLRDESVAGSACLLPNGVWRTVIAVTLPAELGDRPACRIVRQRQARGHAPFEESVWPPTGTVARLQLTAAASVPALDVAPPQSVAPRMHVTAVRLNTAPTPEEWARVPVYALTTSDDTPAPEVRPSTEVRVARTPDALWFRVTARETSPAEGAPNPDGSDLWRQDHIEVFAGPQGYACVQASIGPTGVVLVSLGRTGGQHVPAISAPPGLVARQTGVPGGWQVEVALPLAPLLTAGHVPATRLPERWPWQVQVLRLRAARPGQGEPAQESVLARTWSATAHCPSRYAQLDVAAPGAASPSAATAPSMTSQLLPDAVLSAADRARMRPETSLARALAERALRLLQQHDAALGSVRTAAEWQALRAQDRELLRRFLLPASGGTTGAGTPPRPRLAYDQPTGAGFRRQGVIVETLPGLACPLTLYVPDAPATNAARRPALILIPAHHTSRQHIQLQMFGANFARAGGVAVAMETIGAGERGVSAPWEHVTYHRWLAGVGSQLAGDTYAGWTCTELERVVDYLLARGDVDPARIAAVGAVASGGNTIALAGALDDRIAVTAPFNFVANSGFSDGYYDPACSWPGMEALGLQQWQVAAWVAPRRLIQAQEFDWTPACAAAQEKVMAVYQRLGVTDGLDQIHGVAHGDVTHFGDAHRVALYRIFNRWLGMALPEDTAHEYRTTVSPGSLDCLETPDGRRAMLSPPDGAPAWRQPYELAHDVATARLSAARARQAGQPDVLCRDIAHNLRLQPAETARPECRRFGGPVAWQMAGVTCTVERIWIETPLAADATGRIGVAVWWLRPAPATDKPRPLVLAFSEAGKAVLLATREQDAATLLRRGCDAAFVDLIGWGETSPGTSRSPEGEPASLACLATVQGDSLPAIRMRQMQALLRWAATQPGVDPARIGVWGEGMAPANRADAALLKAETPFREATPQPRRLGQTEAGFLALLTGLLGDAAGGRPAVRPAAVLARGMLTSFLDVLTRPEIGQAADAFIPGIAAVTDVPDVRAALRQAGVAAVVEDSRDGANRAATAPLPKPAGMAALADALREP